MTNYESPVILRTEELAEGSILQADAIRRARTFIRHRSLEAGSTVSR